MIPIRLNLLSPEKKRMHQRTIYVQFTKNVLEVLFIVVCVCSISLLIGLRMIQSDAQAVSSQVIISDSKFVRTNRQVDTINKQIQHINKIQEEYTLWTPLITEFVANIPPGVTVHTLTINRKGKTVMLEGTAATRDALLSLKTSLQKVPWIEPFEISPTLLSAKENISFSLKLTIKE
ncbi:MAG TPA: PilN domain-containing protein [Candidatus Kapabacteria bacterium]|nr:PilN domain-containing protein [Candidatus Kapabacteria bacterium]